MNKELKNASCFGLGRLGIEFQQKLKNISFLIFLSDDNLFVFNFYVILIKEKSFFIRPFYLTFFLMVGVTLCHLY